MRADVFLARFQQVRDGKQVVDLLMHASLVAPHLKFQWYSPVDPRLLL